MGDITNRHSTKNAAEFSNEVILTEESKDDDLDKLDVSDNLDNFKPNIPASKGYMRFTTKQAVEHENYSQSQRG